VVVDAVARSNISPDSSVRIAGLVIVGAYASFLGWLFAAQPATVTEAVGGVASGLGLYSVDPQAFADGLAYFHNEQFTEARAAFSRADPAARDARTQFYVAYSFYRQGWHRSYRDDELYRQGLAAIERAIALAPDRRLVVNDTALQMHSADEVKAELEAGLRLDVSDFNPLRGFDKRK
jgi:tetratricopeptide (TPR) repeat protein